MFGEVAQEVMLGALDVIMPGFTLVSTTAVRACSVRVCMTYRSDSRSRT